MSKIQSQIPVPQACSGMRLDQALALLYPDYSRSRLQKWIKDGQVTVDQEPKRPRDPVTEGQLIEINAEIDQQHSWQGEQGDLNIVYEDEHLLILNKPRGIVVHPGAGNQQGTLVNTLLHYCSQLQQIPRGGIIHRLDKDTSGLLVVAKTLKAHHYLVDQLQQRLIHREYRALVYGNLISGGCIDAPIGRHPQQRTKMAIVPHGGKPAITHYRVLARFSGITYLQVNLETGRTHQIRVHLSQQNNPILGDPTYGGRPRPPQGADPELIARLKDLRQQQLHAYRLILTHPETKAPLEFIAPLPEDMTHLLEILKK